MITKGRQTEKVYRRLLANIDSGLFPVNSCLPAGTELCQQYGVSHPTLRKAVKVLAEESRLIVKHGAGTFVAPPPAPKNGATNIVSVMSIAEDPCLKTLQRLLIKDGYLMNVYLQGTAGWSAAEEGKYLEYVKDHQCAALLAFCSPRKPTHETALRELQYAGVRVIHYEHYRTQLPEQEYILPDYVRAGHMAAVKLLLAGYKHLYLLGRWESAPSNRLIEQGFVRAMGEHGDGYTPETQRLEMLNCDENWETNLRQFVSALPANSGVVCASTGYAETLRLRLAAVGRGPDEVGLLGIQNAAEPDTATVDMLSFQRESQMRRLADIATGDVVNEVRELIAPVWQPVGSVRGGRAASDHRL